MYSWARKVKELYKGEEIFFANGGDRDKENIPEMSVEGINFIFSIGGDDKKNSSSWILKIGSIIMKKGYGELFIIFSKSDDIKVKNDSRTRQGYEFSKTL